MSAVARRGPRPAHERLKRLLVMLPWLMERGEAPVAEMAARFALTEAELVADLELASMCGLPPFVDELIDVFIDEGMVYAGVPRVFTRPLRLTAPEGFGLLAAGRAAMDLPGADREGPLGRALDKLAVALGESRDAEGVVVDLARPTIADSIAAAAERREQLTITYWTPSRDETTTRVIDPRAVFVDRGHWYVLADDQRSGAERSFRLDRILDAAPTGVIVGARPVTLPDTQRWFDPDVERVRIVFPSRLAFVIERYPVDSLEGDGATTTVVMPVVSEEWLARLLLRLGPEATLVSPQRWSSLAAETARRILQRYAD